MSKQKKAQQSSSDHDPLESTSLSLSSLDLKTSKSSRVNFGPWWSSGRVVRAVLGSTPAISKLFSENMSFQ